ncbi:MAG: MerR family transcriptional regulator [Eubacteriales bacterium]|nr:MerR family transcriptional regulator [Eubacteriales bacterium]
MEGKLLREVVEDTGISRRAIQGYEKEGLVHATGKTKMGYLLYDDKSIERIKLIRMYQEIGFRVKDIGKIIDATDDMKKKVLRERLECLKLKRDKMEQLIIHVEQKIKEL